MVKTRVHRTDLMENFSIQYLRRYACPGCGYPTEIGNYVGDLQVDNYRFKQHIIPAHPHGKRVCVVLCPECGMFYKDYVPEPTDLSRLFGSVIGEVWNSLYDYQKEKELVRKFFSQSEPTLLDVGASNGELLKSFAPLCSKLSALDVVKNPTCQRYVNGEYITGWLESDNLPWSGEPYDFVTLFDVVEHLYDVRKAFGNLCQLLKPGGYILLETGDAESGLPRRHGANAWWYLTRIEHHEAFTKSALQKIASNQGFEVVYSERKRHKYLDTYSLLRSTQFLFKSVAYNLCPSGYLKLMRNILDKPIVQPRPLFWKDHMLIILKYLG